MPCNRFARALRAGLLAIALLIAPAASLFGQDQPPSIRPPAVGDEPTEKLPPPKPGELRPEILTKGQVHEAFASPTQLNAKPGQTVKKAPPPAVQELPPEQKPEGDNVKWAPGYWAWDEDRTEHIWISGCWRNMPPGREWVGGYWNKTDDGAFRWVSGYWAKAGEAEQRYIPEQPPDSLEIGPSTPAPGEDYFWAPGGWVNYAQRYLWRPGVWVANQPGWTWSPACYSYTPCGYVWNDGFWDYGLANRGLLFAPVSFGASAYLGGGWGLGVGIGFGGWFQPSVCIDSGLLFGCLWARPWGGYCFGNYFGAGYGWGGYRPWWNCGRKTWCSFNAQQNCANRRNNPNWRGDRQRDYAARNANPNLRPANTLRGQNELAGKGGGKPGGNQLALGQPLSKVGRDAGSAAKLERVSPDQAKRIGQETRTAQQAFAQRAKLETAAAKGQTTPRSVDRQPAIASGTAKVNPDRSPRTLTRPSTSLTGKANPDMPVNRSAATRSAQTDRGASVIRSGSTGQRTISPSVGSSNTGQRTISPNVGSGSQTYRPQLSSDRGRTDLAPRPQSGSSSVLRSPSSSGSSGKSFSPSSGSSGRSYSPSSSGGSSYRSSPSSSGGSSYRSSPSSGGSSSRGGFGGSSGGSSSRGGSGGGSSRGGGGKK